MVIIIGSIFGGAILFFFICCLCGTCHREPTKSPNKNDLYQKNSKSIFSCMRNIYAYSTFSMTMKRFPSLL